MLQWALSFLVIALIAAIFGLTGVAAVSMEIARLVFFIFIALFVVTGIMHLAAGKAPPPPA